ncbi:MAG TPA: methyltransferase domain-containing protein [Kofleriaceae bacterium]|nr:methyltransferase domain-containing protein [Kofleriaceae bacterium]
MRTRSDPGAYERYLRGMDTSMRQKVALTAAHVLSEGVVADMGCGSGACSDALAALYPALEVVGVDADPEMVARARAAFARENLRFEVGDIARPLFPDGSLEAVFDSSVLHHVTSFGGYRHAAAGEAIAVQVAALRVGGVLIVRDFVAPESQPVTLEVPADDGEESDDPRRASTARLLERFAREARSLHARPGIACERLADAREGWRRYAMDLRAAAEFVLRKDYRADWEAEVQEEYTYFTQAEFEACFAAIGLRVLASTPIRNPWIVRHRLRGKIDLRDAAGRALEPPATNILVAGEKVPPGEGVRFREEPTARVGFLEMQQFRHRASGAVRDLVRRPNLTLDVVPWFVHRGAPYVLARMSYPRPILGSRRADPAIDESRPPGYVTEPLNVVMTDRPVGQTVERLLADCGIEPGAIRAFAAGGLAYPSPGGTQEEVRAVHVEIEPTAVEVPLRDLSGFSTSGRVRAIEARQLLRSAQVGGLPDARLELEVRELLARIGIAPGPWIGETLELRPAPAPPPAPSPVAALRARPARRAFDSIAVAGPGFLEIACGEFEELDAGGAVLHRRALEYVLPGRLSTNTIAAAPLWRAGDDVYIGVDDDDLPAAQAMSGNSHLLVAPAWRLPRHLATTTPARAWIAERLRADYGLRCGDTFELGGRYHPSPGLSPEAVWPVAFEVLGCDPAPLSLLWVPLAELAAAPDLLTDGHLRVVAHRAAHALSP